MARLPLLALDKRGQHRFIFRATLVSGPGPPAVLALPRGPDLYGIFVSRTRLTLIPVNLTYVISVVSGRLYTGMHSTGEAAQGQTSFR